MNGFLAFLVAALFGATCTPTATVHRTTASACSDHGAIRGDVDGDDDPDEVAHFWEGDRAVLWLCTATGERLTTDGVGQAENLLLLDVDGDGVYEMLPGGTSASSAGYHVVKYVDGDLVRLAFTLDEGDTDQDTSAAWGCDSERHPVQVTVDWKRRVVRLETIHVTGTNVSRTVATRAVHPGADRTTYARLLVRPCPGVVTR